MRNRQKSQLKLNPHMHSTPFQPHRVFAATHSYRKRIAVNVGYMYAGKMIVQQLKQKCKKKLLEFKRLVISGKRLGRCKIQCLLFV